MKRTLLFVMAVCIFILTAGTYAATSGDYEYTDNGDTTCTITGYTGPGGDVTIPDDLNGLTVTTIGTYAFLRRPSLTSVTIPDSVISIGSGAFEDCDALTNVTLGNSVMTIEGYAFYECSDLSSITIPDSVITIGTGAFQSCGSLTSITIPDSVTTIGSDAFYSCSALASITLPDGVTTIADNMFGICSSLVGIYFKGDAPTLGSDVFSGVTATVYYIPQTTNWGSTFGGLPTSLWCTFSDNGDGTCTITRCGDSGHIILPDSLNGLTVTTIANDACAQCYNLTGLTIPYSVISIEQGAFSPSGLTDITVMPANPAYSSLEGVLFNKTQTELVRYPDRKAGDYTVPNSVTAIGNGAFSSCDDLTSINIHDSVISIGDGAFTVCSNLTGITVVPSNPSYSSLDGVLFNKAQTELIQYPTGKTGDYTIPNGVTTIGDFAFYYCFDLTGTLTIPDSVTTIGNFAFFYCSDLSGVTIGNSVTTIGDFAFGRCEGLTHLTIGSSVMTIEENAFIFCDGLTCVIIPDSVAAIGYRGFYDCSSLASIFFKGDPPSLGSDVFRYTNATAYYLPANAASWPTTFGELPTAVWVLSISDVDVDGDVNLADFAIFAAAWGSVKDVDDEYNPLCDISDPVDNVIDAADLSVFADQWLITPCQ